MFKISLAWNRPNDGLATLTTFLNRYTSQEHLRQGLADVERRLRSGAYLFEDEKSMLADLLRDLTKVSDAPKKLTAEVRKEVLAIVIAKSTIAAFDAGAGKRALENICAHYKVSKDFVFSAVDAYARREFSIRYFDEDATDLTRTGQNYRYSSPVGFARIVMNSLNR